VKSARLLKLRSNFSLNNWKVPAWSGAFYCLPVHKLIIPLFSVLIIFAFLIRMYMIQPILLGMLGTNEIIIILVIVLLLFGGRKIPELMRGLGKGVREFNDAKTNVKKEIEESASEVKNSVKE
jgi:sec-independent protein translocase protein TatA